MNPNEWTDKCCVCGDSFEGHLGYGDRDILEAGFELYLCNKHIHYFGMSPNRKEIFINILKLVYYQGVDEGKRYERES